MSACVLMRTACCIRLLFGLYNIFETADGLHFLGSWNSFLETFGCKRSGHVNMMCSVLFGNSTEFAYHDRNYFWILLVSL